MSAPIELCPACAAPLADEGCEPCARAFPTRDGIRDLRLFPERDLAPHPLERGDLDAFASGAAPGRAEFRASLEKLLLALTDLQSDLLMQVLREGRGAWLPLLRSSAGELLFLGNSLSGAVTPLATFGFQVTCLELSAERARFARLRAESHVPGRVRLAIGGDGPRLAFADRSFDVVLCEEGLPDRAHGYGFPIGECLRVARGEVVLVANNRLGYKRSSGRRGDFRVPNPLEFARLALAPGGRERTLGGYRAALAAPGFERARAYSLYPHQDDFTHVVAIDAAAPELTVGPMERKNRLKLAGRALGLFPVLTPSFALIGARTELGPVAPRIERMLAEIAERVGEPRPEVEQLVATRGNSAIVHTRLPGADGSGPEGRWTLHVPLAPKNQPQIERHFAMLELLRERFPDLPVPEPLWMGGADGVSVTVERRASGWTAPQRSGDRPRIARMLAEVAQHFARLVTRKAHAWTAEDFEGRIGARFDKVIEHANVLSTVTRLKRLRAEMRERMVGQSIPLVIYHADLRAKHVQIDREGHVLAILDWGTAEVEGPPYYDLLQLFVHERKQEDGLSPEQAWRIVRERRELRDEERAALDGYVEAIGLDPDVARAFEAMYPVLVAAMAETHWDFSRPRWLHKQFGM